MPRVNRGLSKRLEFHGAWNDHYLHYLLKTCRDQRVGHRLQEAYQKMQSMGIEKGFTKELSVPLVYYVFKDLWWAGLKNI